MSDGALSQDEIDALLAGVDSSSFGAGGMDSGGSSGGGKNLSVLKDFLASTVQSLSSNLSMMTGSQISVSAPSLEQLDREAFVQKLPEMATAVKADFNSGFPGSHLYIMPENSAKKIASLMNQEENIELDDMALSVIGEVASQLTGTLITAISDKTGNKNVSSVSPEASNVPKAVVALPGGNFTMAEYKLTFENGEMSTLWEVFDSSVSDEMLSALGGGPEKSGMDAGFGMQQGAPMQNQMNDSMGMMGGAMGNQAQAMGGFGMGNPSTNVQSVQFPNLMQQQTSGEQGNIGLIMDVYMEMTVELGRTRKLIKEILGMGEGTIIELDKLAGEPVDILVNHKLIAKGEVVVIDENFGVRVTEIVSPMERMSDMG